MLQNFKGAGIAALVGLLGIASLVGCGKAASNTSAASSAPHAPVSSGLSSIRCEGGEFVLKMNRTSLSCGENGVTDELWAYETAIVGTTDLIDQGTATFFCDQRKAWATLLSDVTGNRLRLDARRNGTYDLSQVGFYIDTLRCDANF